MPVLSGQSPDLPPVEIVLKRSATARRFSLRVSRLDGRVTLSLPLRARESEAMAFAYAQEGWIRRTLADLPQQVDAAQDVEVLVLEFVDVHGGTPGVMKRARRVVRQSARAASKPPFHRKLQAIAPCLMNQ